MNAPQMMMGRGLTDFFKKNGVPYCLLKRLAYICIPLANKRK